MGRLWFAGPTIENDIRYNAEFAFLIPLTLVLAYSEPASWVGVVRPGRALPARAAAITAAAAVGAFCVALGGTYRRLYDGWPTGQVQSWVENLRSSVAALARHTADLTLVNSPLPIGVGPPGDGQFDQLAQAVPGLDDPQLRVGPPGAGTLAAASSTGTVAPAVAKVLAGGPADELSRQGVLTSTSPQDGTTTAAGYCTHTSSGLQLRYHPAGGVGIQVAALEVTLTPGHGAGTLWVYLNTGAHYPEHPDSSLLLRPQTRAMWVPLPNGKLVGAIIGLAPTTHVCIGRVQVVGYTAS
jgi:hypothetical protein